MAARPRTCVEPAPPRFIAYYRVSTAQRRRTGLGLEAQREAATRYVASVEGEVIGDHLEIESESGKRAVRPQLAAALAACRATRSVLLVAKLDRLSRNLAFLANLMDAEVDFVCCDTPHATRFTLHILAAVAEHERVMISARTKAALAAAKVRGVVLGNPNIRAGDGRVAAIARAARVQQASTRAVSLALHHRRAPCGRCDAA